MKCLIMTNEANKVVLKTTGPQGEAVNLRLTFRPSAVDRVFTVVKSCGHANSRATTKVLVKAHNRRVVVKASTGQDVVITGTEARLVDPVRLIY